jgi:membrane protease YdiL (CAAX protease family)
MIVLIPSRPIALSAPASVGQSAPWGILASIVVAAVAFAVRGPLLAYPPLHALLQASHQNFLQHSALIVAIQSASLLVIAAAIWLKGWPLAAYLNFTRPRARDVALGVALVLVWYLIQNGYFYVAHGRGFGLAPYQAALAAGMAPWWFVLQAWPSFVCAPIVEESAFRGFLWRGVETRLGAVAAFLITSLCFTATHYPAFVDVKHWTVRYEVLVVYAVTALILGWLRWRSGSIATTMIVHGFLNFWMFAAPVLFAFFVR